MQREFATAGAALMLLLISGFVFVEDPPIRGVAFGLFDLSIEPGQIEHELDEIRHQGANSISIPVLWFQEDANSTSIHHAVDHGGTLARYDALITHTIAAAHDRDMSVLLMPVVGLEHAGPGQWRGNMGPANWEDWFASYEAFVGHYAALAQREAVEWFAVGSELSSTEVHTEAWIDVIGHVRSVFRGQLTYSANWDHFETAAFWQQLDALGISGYYTLTNQVPATYASILRGWADRRAQLAAWQQHNDLPLIMTEVGYPSLATAARAPWDYTSDGPVDLTVQRLCYRAFVETWRDSPHLAGAYLWIWVPGEGGRADRGYAWRGKPAAADVKTWLQDI